MKSDTFIKSGSIHSFMADIAKVRVLTKEEEYDLFEGYKERNDESCYSRIVNHNLRFVVFIAKKHYQKHPKIQLDDLVQEGCMGLLTAIQSFDYKKGVRFATYAVYHIKEKILDFIVRNFSMVKIATTKADRKLFFNSTLVNTMERSLKKEEIKKISEELDVKTDEVIEMERRLKSHDVTIVDEYMMDDTEDHENKWTKVFTTDPFDDGVVLEEIEAKRKEVLSFISSNLDEFSDIERTIIENRILKDEDKMSLKSIGDSFGISLQAVDQRERYLKKKIADKIFKFLRKSGTSLNDII